MATVNKNLSNYDFSLVPSARGMKFGIAVADWNENITEGLFKGAMDALLNCGCEESNIIRKNVPGSFELPLAAQFFFESTDVDAVICLGSVIQGETKHFDYVCQGTSLGIKDVVAKSTGTSNPHNMLKATFDAFKQSESPKSVAAKRSKKVNEIIKNKNSKEL